MISNEVSTGKYTTRTQSVLHQFQVILCKNWTVEILQLDSPIFDSLLNDLTFSPSFRRNLKISSMRELSKNFGLMVQYQFLRDIEYILKFLEVCVSVYCPNVSVIWSKMNTGFIVVDIDNPQINTSVFKSSTGASSSEICTLWNSNLVLPN